jgi:hypothetical protein
MKIIVEVEVPEGEYCDVASCDFHGIYNSCELFGSNLEKIFIYGTSKCPACLVACQKAMECEPKPLPTRDFLVSCGSGGTVVLDGTGRIKDNEQD